MTDNCKILVVDDDNAHRTMLRTLIGGWGYEIDDADDGEAAIDKVKEKFMSISKVVNVIIENISVLNK